MFGFLLCKVSLGTKPEVWNANLCVIMLLDSSLDRLGLSRNCGTCYQGFCFRFLGGGSHTLYSKGDYASYG